MALSFGSATTNKVNHGSAAALDNLATGTIVLWIKPVSVGAAFRGWASKGLDSASSGWLLHQRSFAGQTFRFALFRATSDLAIVSTIVLTTDWQCIAATWDIAVSGSCVLYRGSLTSLMATCVDTVDVGSGAVVTDAGDNLIVGNVDIVDTSSANALIASIAIWNRVLTANEVKQQQFRLTPTSGCQILTHYYGTGLQPDYSGHLNVGTVTGATAAAHVPLGPIFGNKTGFAGWPAPVAGGSLYRKRNRSIHEPVFEYAW